MKKILSILLILAVSTQIMVAQSLRKANNLFENRAYSNAAKLYLEEKNKTQEVLEKLGDSYYYTSNMEGASKWYQVLMDEHFKGGNVNPEHLFKYAHALKGVGNITEADKWYNLYNEKQGNESSSFSTAEFVESLNNNIKRPYSAKNIAENTVGSEFGISIRGDKALFASSRGGGNTYKWNKQPYLDLYEANIEANGELSNVAKLNSTINTKVHEANAIVTSDGQTMYFTRNNFNDGKKVSDKNKVSHLKIYTAKLVDGEWSNVTELPFNDDNFSVMHPALNRDESKLYFSSDMPSSIGSFDIYFVEINLDGTYGEPQNLGSKINTPFRDQFPYLSSYGNLYFSSDGHFGLGGLDVFKCMISGDYYDGPLNLSDKINSNKDDFAFVIDEEQEIGYFTSNREGGKGDDDIYSFIQASDFFVSGTAIDDSTRKLLPGTLIALTENGNKISEVTVGSDGKYSMPIQRNKNYTLKASLKTYNPKEISFSTNEFGDVDKNIRLSLISYEDSEDNIVTDHGKLQIKINPIYFWFDSWKITPEAATELNEAVRIMQKYPEMKIEIGTHTDSRGEDDYNLELSNKRANSVREYLVENGIPTENVQSKGYGETQLVNRCSNDVRCYEKEHFANRRCEFVILN